MVLHQGAQMIAPPLVPDLVLAKRLQHAGPEQLCGHRRSYEDEEPNKRPIHGGCLTDRA